MVRLETISKSFEDQPVLRNVSLEIEEGEIFILLGRSGCGKTTLLRIIAGFEEPEFGRILINNEDVTSVPVEQRPVGIIFQSHALFPHMTVYDNIALGPRVRGVPEIEIKRQIDDLLHMTHLEALRYAWPEQISGGESQRVAVARAIINRPKLLLLDEPLSSLDPSLRQSLREELVQMRNAFGITFLFVTHDQEEAMSLGDRIGLLEAGKLAQVGTPSELYHHPATPTVAQFLGEINRFSGVLASRENGIAEISVPEVGNIRCPASETVATGTPVFTFVRPEKTYFGSKPNHGEGKWNRLTGVLEGKSFFGTYTRYQIKIGNGETIHVLRTSENELHEPSFSLGESASVWFDPSEVHLFE